MERGDKKRESIFLKKVFQLVPQGFFKIQRVCGFVIYPVPKKGTARISPRKSTIRKSRTFAFTDKPVDYQRFKKRKTVTAHSWQSVSSGLICLEDSCVVRRFARNGKHRPWLSKPVNKSLRRPPKDRNWRRQKCCPIPIGRRSGRRGPKRLSYFPIPGSQGWESSSGFAGAARWS